MSFKKLKPLFIPALVVVIFVLSVTGYKQHSGDHFDFWAAVYATIASFLMHHVAPEAEHGYLVLIAQYLAALILGLGLFSLIYDYLKEKITESKIRYNYAGHIIVFHLNHIGRNICLELLQNGYKVVAVEPEKNNSFVDEVRKAGGIVLHKNVLEAETIEAAALEKAWICVLANENDIENIELANTISRYRHEHRKSEYGILKLMVHITNTDNVNVIKDFYDINNEDEHYDLETFNVQQLAAQKLYDQFPPHKFFNGSDEGGQYAIAIIGYNRTAENFIVENTILSHYPGIENLKIYLVDKDADTAFHELNYKYPFYSEFVEIVPVKQLNASFFANFSWSKKNIEQLTKIKAAYFFGDNDSALINSATSFRQFLYAQTLAISDIPLIVCLSEDTGIVNLLNSAANYKQNAVNLFSEQLNIHQFRQISDTCRSETIEETALTDKLSKAINYFYSVKYDFSALLSQHHKIHQAENVIAQLEKEMIDLSEKRASITLEELEQVVLIKLSKLTNISPHELEKEFSVNKRWQLLTQRKKDSNRYAARHAAVKTAALARIGCRPVNIENIRKYYPRIAPVEHKRWNAEKMVFNFKYGVIKQPAQKRFLKETLKIHDQIIPFDKLSDEEKNKDLNLFLLLPLLTAIKQLSQSEK